MSKYFKVVYSLFLVVITTLFIFVLSSKNNVYAYSGAHSESNSSGDVFLGGKYIELGISKHGSFGTSVGPKSSGFHTSNKLGMIIDEDGWDQGNAPTTGDFFLPGTPEERYIFSYYIGSTCYEYKVADRQNVLTGNWKTTPYVTNKSSGNLLKAEVYGVTTHNIAITITYSFYENDQFYQTDVFIQNLGTSTLSNVRFVRSFDPDQDQEKNGTYNTYNKVVCNPKSTNPGGIENYALVVARGAKTLKGFFFIAFDNRARASANVEFALSSAYNTGLWTDNSSLPTFATDSSINMSFSNTNGYTNVDNSIAITFKLDNISPNNTDHLNYFSSLSPDITGTLEQTQQATAPKVVTLEGASLDHGYLTGGPKVMVEQVQNHKYEYQWYKNTTNSNIGGTIIDGATSETYNVPLGKSIGTVEYYYCEIKATRLDSLLASTTITDAVTINYVGSHNFVYEKTTNPTCKENGYDTYICSICNDTKHENEVPNLGHHGSWVTVKNPTCQDSGIKHLVCDNCEEVLSVSYVPSLGHNFVLIESKDVTCAEDGYQKYQCSACLETYIVTTHSEHEYNLTKIEATCTEEGANIYTCIKCNDVYKEIIPASHEYVSEITKVATNTEDGIITYTCKKCNHSYTEIIPASCANVLLIQDVLPWSEDNATKLLKKLVSDGYITGWIASTVKGLSKVDLAGITTIYIANDQTNATYSELEKFTEIITSFANAGGTVVYGACDGGWNGGTISYKLPLGVEKVRNYSVHNYINDFNHPIVTGILTNNLPITNDILVGNYCSHSSFKTSSLPVDANIILKDANGNATLAEYSVGSGSVIVSGLTWEFFYSRNYQGSTSYSKNVFDDLIVYAASNSKEVVEHFYDEGKVVNPTCEEQGYTLYTCTDCGKTYKANLVPALGHLMDGSFDITKNATCTNTGLAHQECSRCGHSVTITLPALGHTIGDWVIDTLPTCTTIGKSHRACTICNEIIQTSYEKAIGHNYDSEVITYATCTHHGIIAHTCANCGDSYNTLTYAEHNYEEVNYVAATCTVDGKHEYECTKCHDKYVEVIDASHDYQVVETILATRETEGHVKYECSICHDSYEITLPIQEAATVLLVQDRLPWSTGVNEAILKKLLSLGYITGYDVTTTANIGSFVLSNYSAVFIANDQTTATYNALKKFNDAITEYVNIGGTVIYGACDHGWSNGNISYALPGGVTKNNYYSYRNYIVNSSHEIVTAELTDGMGLTDKLLYSTYSSHTYFNKSSLPKDANIILSDANGNPTLVEYAIGEGHVIASGLTWEYTYDRTFVDGTSFAKCVYDDVIVYAVSLQNKCEHIFDDGKVVDPTCELGGYLLHTCTKCNATLKDEYTLPLGHTEGEWEVVEAQEVGKDGKAVIKCITCGEILEEKVLPSIDKIVGNVNIDENKHGVLEVTTLTFNFACVETLTELNFKLDYDANNFDVNLGKVNVALELIKKAEIVDGVLVVELLQAINGKDFSFDILVQAKKLVDKDSISFECTTYNEGVATSVTIDAVKFVIDECNHPNKVTSYINEEYHGVVCPDCMYTELVPHTHEIDKGIKPTCTMSGLSDGSHCTVCHEITIPQVVVDALGHTEVIDKEVKPTCTTSGLTEGAHCEVCKEVLVPQVVVDALGHTKVIDAEVKPTCTTTGLTEGSHCEVCKEVFIPQVVIDVLGHTEVIDAEVKPTCTLTGLTEGSHCEVCKEVLIPQVVVDALGHTEVIDKEVKPTCTTSGLTEGAHCEVCKEVLIPQVVVDALGHTEVIDAEVKPTCTTTGLTEGSHCEVCKEVFVPQVVIDALGHTEVIDAEIKPTCTTSGLTEGSHCEVCKEVFVPQVVVDALGHTEVIDAEVKPTCTLTGLTEGSHCEVCKEVLIPQVVVDALGHTIVIDAEIKPTCTTSGLTEGSHCEVCKEVLVPQVVVDALGHTEVIDKELKPTCTTSGLTEGSHCEVCKEVLISQVVIDALGHTEVIDAEVKPTCTLTGLTEGSHCEVCKEVLISQVVIDALGHTEVIDAEIKPTCTTTGLTEGSHCEVCKEVLVPQVVVDALGHDFSSEPSFDEVNHYHSCDRCKEILTNVHVFEVKQNNTSILKVCTCGYYTEEEIKAETTTEDKVIIKIELPVASTSADEVNLSFDLLKHITDVLDDTEMDSALTLSFGNSSVSYDLDALKSILDAYPEGNVNIVLGKVEDVDDKLNNLQKEILQNASEEAVVFEINLTVDGTQVHDFGGGKAAISMPFELPENWDATSCAVYRLEDDGTMVLMETSYADGTITWITDGHSYYMLSQIIVEGTNDEKITKIEDILAKLEKETSLEARYELIREAIIIYKSIDDSSSAKAQYDKLVAIIQEYNANVSNINNALTTNADFALGFFIVSTVALLSVLSMLRITKKED